MRHEELEVCARKTVALQQADRHFGHFFHGKPKYRAPLLADVVHALIYGLVRRGMQAAAAFDVQAFDRGPVGV